MPTQVDHKKAGKQLKFSTPAPIRDAMLIKPHKLRVLALRCSGRVNSPTYKYKYTPLTIAKVYLVIFSCVKISLVLATGREHKPSTARQFTN